MRINKAYKFRIYPNQDQQVLIAKTIGCSRFIFNHFLDKWNHAYKEAGKGLAYGTCSAGLPLLKKELSWLKEVDSIALQSSVRNLADSFDRFFKKQNNAPRFKSKSNPIQSFTTKHTNGNIAVIGNAVNIQIFSAVIYIVLLINFRKGISAHNKRYPNRKLSFFQLKPFEYIEDDEGWIFITRGASQKVYEFFYWALPTSLLIHLVFDVPQYGVVINILVLAIMQFLIYYLEIRKYVQEDIESDGNELF